MPMESVLSTFIIRFLRVYPFSCNFHFGLMLNCLTYKIREMYDFSVAFSAQWSPEICLPDTNITNTAFFSLCCLM